LAVETILTFMSIKTTMRTRATPVSHVDRVFRAFADRTRLRILHLLQGGELCVSDIINILRVPQAKASHHLNYLRRAGLVDVRKHGLWCIYSLRPAETPFHQKLLDCLGQCFTGVPGLAADRERAAKVRASGGCCPKDASGISPVGSACVGSPGLDGTTGNTTKGKKQ
jgi:ArsR family transcriptional regulator